jgi:hypothetical protein
MWRRKKASRSLSALVVIGSWFSSKRRNGGKGEHKRGLRRHVEHDSGAQRTLLQPARSQPSADTNEQLHSRRPFIPTDLVQNTAEYLGRVAGLLSFRGVSTEWQGAVSDAVGFLNGRCWNRLECNDTIPDDSRRDSDELWTRLRLDDAASSLAALCCVSDLGSRR